MSTPSSKCKVVVFVPVSHADIVRETMGRYGAGTIGNYTNCSFSSRGSGRFLPQNGAHPAIGEVGKFELVDEERIEMVAETQGVNELLAAIRSVHPYEEVVIDVYPLLTPN